MPRYNVTVDDVSAIFEYYIPNTRVWTDSPTSDQELHNYWDSTYHSSNQFGAQASVMFQGTAVYLFAAKRSRHGTYGIYLDGLRVYDGDSYSASPLYNQIMYNATDLAPTWHNLTIVNSDPSNQTYTEVDYIRWTTLMPESLTETFGTPISYSPNNMSYSSLNAWNENRDGSNPSMVTSTDGASVNITFNGNGIELYGKTGPNYGRFSAQVEGDNEHQLNANSEQIHDTMLFRQDNLTSGRHTILVTNRGTSSLAITSAKPILWRGPNSPNPDTPSGSHTISTATIAGAVVGVVVGMAAVLFILLFVLRRRRRKQRENDLRVHSSHEPAFIDATPFELPASPNEQAVYAQSPSSARFSKHRSEGSQYAAYPLQYQPVLGSPGMSSRGSFETPQSAGLGVPSSSAGGSSSGRPASAGTGRSGGKYRRSAEPTSREEVPQGVEVIRDSDAGPILLPPAYSAAMEARAPVDISGSFAPSASSLVAPISPTPVSTTPVPAPSTPTLPPGAALPIITNSGIAQSSSRISNSSPGAI
ncbi:unnamed protein product [Rhizoctonia solani]|uniref:Uncharacterized protein n=1 Tax=Rhizoctonia solani TaxID=456999 RepID=A0A8H3HCD9_9AGAM|nr:unnamed protein product [Rhizoctonia solani]